MFGFLHLHEKEHGVGGHFTICGRPQIIEELGRQRGTHYRYQIPDVGMLVMLIGGERT